MNAAPELAEENALLKAELESKNEQLQDKEQLLQDKDLRIQILEEMLRLANIKHFASSSEKLESPQQALFNEAEDELVEPDQEAESEETVTVPAHARKKQKRV